MRIAMFGGSFNPPHIGHLQLADEVFRTLKLEKIYFVPAARPAHKILDNGASEEQRLEMLRLATADEPGFGVLDWEIARGGTSYTIDTLRRISAEFCGEGEKPGLIIGADLADGFGSWRTPNDIVEVSTIVLCTRDGVDPGTFNWPHLSIDNTSFRVSSSMVRERIRAGKSYRYLLSSEVYAYVKNHGLYL